VAALLVVLAIGGCGFGSSAPKPAAHHPSPSARPSPSPSAAVAASAYWVLATLGLRLHQAPDTASTVVTVLRPGAQLDVTEARTVGGVAWLHVHAHAQADLDGWVVNDPLLVTDIPMQQHDDAALGYTLLYPTAWTFTAGGAATSIFASSDGRQKLTVEVADSLAHLPPEPTAAGKADHEEGPLDVYGKSPVLTYYKLDAGGWELFLSFLWANGRAFGFVFRVPTADSALLKQVLASVIIR
jgi:Bacterial SH3 domain